MAFLHGVMLLACAASVSERRHRVRVSDHRPDCQSDTSPTAKVGESLSLLCVELMLL